MIEIETKSLKLIGIRSMNLIIIFLPQDKITNKKNANTNCDGITLFDYITRIDDFLLFRPIFTFKLAYLHGKIVPKYCEL